MTYLIREIADIRVKPKPFHSEPTLSEAIAYMRANYDVLLVVDDTDHDAADVIAKAEGSFALIQFAIEAGEV